MIIMSSGTAISSSFSKINLFINYWIMVLFLRYKLFVPSSSTLLTLSVITKGKAHSNSFKRRQLASSNHPMNFQDYLSKMQIKINLRNILLRFYQQFSSTTLLITNKNSCLGEEPRTHQQKDCKLTKNSIEKT